MLWVLVIWCWVECCVCNNCKHKKHIFLETIFVQANVDGGCCTADNNYHRRCLYDGVNDQEQCKSLRAIDTGCKGFVMLESNPDYCQLATTSPCPSHSRGPFDVNNVQSLDPSASCSIGGKWNGGCYIKQGL